MSSTDLIADMIRGGVDPVLIQRTVDALIETARMSAIRVMENSDDRSPGAKRQAAYRERKASQNVTNRNKTSQVTDEESPSLSLLPPSQTLPPSHPHTPIREAAKPATASATPPPEGFVLKPQSYSEKRPKTPKAEKPADPRHAEFVRIFAEEYETQTGSPYAMQGGKDGQQLQTLLRTLPTLTAAEWRNGLRWSWEIASRPYTDSCVRQTGSLAAFCCAWNRIVAYNSTYKENTRR